MMNKGLEVIEVYWFFGVLVDKIEVVIYLQSVIYFMVLYVDGFVLVQLGNFDMCMFIVNVLVYLECIVLGVVVLDLVQIV